MTGLSTTHLGTADIPTARCRVPYWAPLARHVLSTQGLARTWWMPFIAILPVLNVLILRGWRLEFVERLSSGRLEPLPDPTKIGRFLKQGIVASTVTLTHFVLPLALFFILVSPVRRSWIAFLIWMEPVFELSKAGPAVWLEAAAGWIRWLAGEGAHPLTLSSPPWMTSVEARLSITGTVLVMLVLWLVERVAMVDFSLTRRTGSLLGQALLPGQSTASPQKVVDCVLLGIAAAQLIFFFSILAVLSGPLGLLSLLAAIPAYYIATAALYSRLSRSRSAEHLRTSQSIGPLLKETDP